MTILSMGIMEYTVLFFNLVLLCGVIGGLWFLLSRLRQLVS